MFAVVLLALIALPPGGSFAGELENAKQAGSVGERPDGYLGVVDKNAGAAIEQMVEEINGKRREKYAAIAKKNGTTVKAVAALAGAKLIEKAAPGEYVMRPSGKWIRVPAP
jgi:uncharacterized protein YdbL (DUF1318 family)